MAEPATTTCLLRDGRTLSIESCRGEYAEQCLEYLKCVGGETDFLLVGPDGIPGMTVEKEAAFLEQTRAAERGCMLLGFVDGELVSIANIQTRQHPRVMHNAGLGISVKKAFWRLGVGSAMLSRLLAFARGIEGVRFARLEVYADNARAIALYERFGFQTIGRRHDYLLVNGRYHDELEMECPL